MCKKEFGKEDEDLENPDRDQNHKASQVDSGLYKTS